MKKDNITKRSFPIIKKHLKWFLTDESWKITKKDALWLSVLGTILSAWEQVMAAHSSVSHGSACWHVSQADFNAWTDGTHINAPIATHSSGVVSGHYNQAPSGGHMNSATTSWTHISQGAVNASQYCPTHASHASHGSHGSCWRGCW